MGGRQDSNIVFGGHVQAGEDYPDTVGREAEEEAGVTSQPFFMASFRKRFDDRDREMLADARARSCDKTGASDAEPRF